MSGKFQKHDEPKEICDMRYSRESLRLNAAKHLPADSATVAAFWVRWFALAYVLAFRKTPCGGIGGR